MTATPPLTRWLLLAAGLLLSVLGILGLVRGERAGWAGFIYSPQRIVEVVEPGSAAADAGVRTGDSVAAVDGRPAADLPMQSRWATTRPGQTHRLELVREGRPVAVEVTYRPRGPNPFAQGALAVLLVFLWGGLWAWLTTATPAARALGWSGLAAGIALAATPDVGGPWNGVLSHLQLVALVLVVLFILRLVLILPSPKRVSASRGAAAAALVPVLLVVGFAVLELVTHPRLYRSMGTVAGLVMLVYLALAVAALVHSVVTTPRGTIWGSGLGWALVGAALAIAAIAVPMVGMVVYLPGAEWAQLLLAALPLALALAVRRQARAAP